MSVDPHCRWQEGTHDNEVDGIVALVGERIASNRKEGGGVIRFRTCEKWKTPPRLSGVFLFPSIALIIPSSRRRDSSGIPKSAWL
ncbi:MAG TPA: hypothetical protein VN154_04970 [Rhizomicrobium sp.]|nr:hypothetical protein [Rhizomicrobium sp.]